MSSTGRDENKAALKQEAGLLQEYGSLEYLDCLWAGEVSEPTGTLKLAFKFKSDDSREQNLPLCDIEAPNAPCFVEIEVTLKKDSLADVYHINDMSDIEGGFAVLEEIEAGRYDLTVESYDVALPDGSTVEVSSIQDLRIEQDKVTEKTVTLDYSPGEVKVSIECRNDDEDSCVYEIDSKKRITVRVVYTSTADTSKEIVAKVTDSTEIELLNGPKRIDPNQKLTAIYAFDIEPGNEYTLKIEINGDPDRKQQITSYRAHTAPTQRVRI
jgi:hypothetical protein